MIKGIIYFSSWLREVPQELLFEEPWLKCRLYVIAEANWYWYIRCCWYHVSRQNSLSQSRYLHKEQLPYNLYNDFSFLEDTLIGLCFIIRTVLKREKGRGRERKTKKLLIQAVTSHWSKNISQGVPCIQKSWNILTFTFRLSKIPYFSNTAKFLFTNQVIPAVAGECCFISVKETFVKGYLLTQFSVSWIARRWADAFNLS